MEDTSKYQTMRRAMDAASPEPIQSAAPVQEQTNPAEATAMLSSPVVQNAIATAPPQARKNPMEYLLSSQGMIGIVLPALAAVESIASKGRSPGTVALNQQKFLMDDEARRAAAKKSAREEALGIKQEQDTEAMRAEIAPLVGQPDFNKNVVPIAAKYIRDPKDLIALGRTQNMSVYEMKKQDADSKRAYLIGKIDEAVAGGLPEETAIGWRSVAEQGNAMNIQGLVDNLGGLGYIAQRDQEKIVNAIAQSTGQAWAGIAPTVEKTLQVQNAQADQKRSEERETATTELQRVLGPYLELTPRISAQGSIAGLGSNLLSGAKGMVGVEDPRQFLSAQNDVLVNLIAKRISLNTGNTTESEQKRAAGMLIRGNETPKVKALKESYLRLIMDPSTDAGYLAAKFQGELVKAFGAAPGATPTAAPEVKSVNGIPYVKGADGVWHKQ